MNRKELFKSFGDRLKDCRLKLRLSQQDIAEKTDIHRNYISDAERGTRNCCLEIIYKIIVIGLEITLEEFFEGVK